MRFLTAFGLAVTVFLVPRNLPAAPAVPITERFLIEGKLAEGEKVLAQAIATNPSDDQSRFGLGVVQFLRGVERLVQGLHRYGMRDIGGGMVPFLRLPVPPNANPRAIRYEDVRGLFSAWVEDMTRAEATLAKIQDPTVKLPLHFGLIRLDLDGNGRAEDEETLWKIYARFNQQVNRPQAGGDLTAAKAETFVITFDRGDVAWLRGYCHLLTALGEFILAHDSRELFNHSAHLIFPRPQTPFPFLRHGGEKQRDLGTTEIVDLIATIHVIRLSVAEAPRMTRALEHLQAMIVLGRESWMHYEAETDDDHEWIPNPKQTSVLPGAMVNDEMIKGWKDFLDEADRLLAGKRLVPFWRDLGGSRGINLRRVFTEPTPFDLVLWVQGSAAAPYLEDGSITRPEVWQRLQRVFGGEFIGFAFWFN